MNVIMARANRLKTGINNPRTFTIRLRNFICSTGGNHRDFLNLIRGKVCSLVTSTRSFFYNCFLEWLHRLCARVTFHRRTLRTLRKTCFAGTRYEVTVQRVAFDGKLSDIRQRQGVRSEFTILYAHITSEFYAFLAISVCFMSRIRARSRNI